MPGDSLKKYIMATTTATILVGRAHQNHSGIIPTHLIRLTENSRPALIMQSLEGMEDVKIVIPTLENMVDDIYLMIAVFVLKKFENLEHIHNEESKSIYDLFSEKERYTLYNKTKKIIRGSGIKVVFNILDNSHLLSQIDIIKKYPKDIEVTLPSFKKEFNTWNKKVTAKGI